MIENRLRSVWLIFLCWNALSCTRSDAGFIPSLDGAETAHIQLDLRRTRQILEGVSNDRAAPKADRVLTAPSF